MKVHHGGRFTNMPGRKYISGKVQFVDLVDSELFTVEVLNNIVKLLKYDPKQIMYYHFKLPRKSLDWGLRALASDDDIVNMINYVGKHKVIEVFIEHNETTFDSYYMPTFRSRIEIRELQGNDEIVDLDELDVQGKNVPGCRKMLAIEWMNDETVDDVLGHLSEAVEDEHIGDEGVNSDNSDEGVNSDNANEGDSDNADEGVNHENVDEGVNDIIDEEHIVDEVEVNMTGFRLTVDGVESNAEPLHPEVNLTEDDIDVFDFDSYGSDVGSDSDTGRKSELRKLKKQGKAAAHESRIVNFFYVGQEFVNKEEAKSRIKAHIVETRRNIQLKKNDGVRLRAKCYGTIPTEKEGESLGTSGQRESLNKQNKTTTAVSLNSQKGKGKKVIQQEDNDNKCPWVLYIHYSEKTQKWVVTTFKDEHKCLLSRKIKACTSTFLSQHVVDLIQLNPEMPVKAIQAQMQKQFHVGVSIHKAFRAKAKAESVIKGDAQIQYGLLRDYVLELQKANPNTTVKLDFEREGDPESTTRTFKRIYVCMGALKQGFKAGGRDLLGLDGAFMKGQYPGQLLTAVSVDANNGIYPVAYGIVESESLQSWLWFLTQLGDDLDLYPDSHFTFISDRQKVPLLLILRILYNMELYML